MGGFPDIFTEMAVLLLLAAGVSANDQINLLAKSGISLLLFVVELNLDLHIIRTMGPVALATGPQKAAQRPQVTRVLLLAYATRPR